MTYGPRCLFVFWFPAAFGGCLGLVTLCIVYGVVLAWRGKTSSTHWAQRVRFCCRKFGLVPLFCFLLVITCVFQLVFIIGSTTVSDLCVGSPDPRFLAIMNEMDGLLGSTIEEFAIWYIGGCPAGQVPLGITNETEIFIEYGTIAYDVLGGLATVSNDTLKELCGASADPGPLAASARTIQEILCNLATILRSLDNFFACQNWRRLYTLVSVRSPAPNHTKQCRLTFCFHFLTVPRRFRMTPCATTGMRDSIGSQFACWSLSSLHSSW